MLEKVDISELYTVKKVKSDGMYTVFGLYTFLKKNIDRYWSGLLLCIEGGGR